MKKLTEFQLDAIKEICSIGACNAATAISQMVKRKITMSVPEIKLVAIADVSNTMGNPQSLVAGVYSKILGELSGGFLLTFPRESAFTLCDVLLNKPIGETKLLRELDKSALQEAGNIIAGAFVSALSKILTKNLIISVPKFAFDMAGAIIDFILIELAEIAEQAVVMEIVFADIPETIQGKFFILPDPTSLEILLSAVETK